MNKIGKCIIVLLLSITLFSCSKADKGSDEFEEWSKTLPSILLGNKDYTLYSIFNDPSSVGIEMDVDGLTISTKEEYEESIQEYRSILKELRTFDYEDLNEDQKITYDVLENSLNDSINMEEHYYLSTNYFDVNNGVQSALVLNLYFMDLQSKEVLDAIFKVMESTTNMFPQYVAFEKERQEAGFGMSETYRNEVLSQLNTFNSMDHSYLVEGISSKIDEVEYLSEDEKVSYKKELKDIYDHNFIPAYQQLEKDIKALEIKTKDKDASMVDYKDGKEYYRKLIYDTTGFQSVDEFDYFLSQQESKITKRLVNLLNEYPVLYDAMNKGEMPEAEYTDLTNVKDTMAYLEEKVNTSGAFPKLENVEYNMDIVPEALQEIYKAAAAYYVGAFDDPNNKEQMILNGDFEQSDYNTLAHEGFPGHLYQFRYFKSIDHNVLRDILGNGGYSEGWAVYASKEMNQYALDNAICEYMSLNEDMVYIYIMRMDMMIHYDNATREEVYDYLENNFSGLDEESMKATYEQVLLDPAIFMPYYGYYFRILDLKEDAQEEWGNKYSDYKFHKVILDLGALPYPLLEMYFEEFYY